MKDIEFTPPLGRVSPKAYGRSNRGGRRRFPYIEQSTTWFCTLLGIAFLTPRVGAAMIKAAPTWTFYPLARECARITPDASGTGPLFRRMCSYARRPVRITTVRGVRKVGACSDIGKRGAAHGSTGNVYNLLSSYSRFFEWDFLAVRGGVRLDQLAVFGHHIAIQLGQTQSCQALARNRPVL